MARKNVQIIPYHFYHIYNKAVSDNLLFLEDRNYEFFVSKIQQYLLETADILAYCLMPNHYHIIVRIKKPGFPSSMHKLALSYAVSFNNFYNSIIFK